MKKETTYLLNFILISAVVFVIGYVSTNYLIKVSTTQFLELQIESSKREAQQFSNLISNQIQSGVAREVLVNNIQKSIEGSETENGFICMFDWSGVEICHPEPKYIGQKVNSNEYSMKSVDSEMNSEDFYNLLKEKKQRGGIVDFEEEDQTQIIYLYPVKDSDWIIAAHANIDNIEKEIDKLKTNFLTVYILTSIGIIIFSLITVRYLGNYYQRQLEFKNEQLTEEVINLSKLNANLTNYKNKISDKIEDKDDDKEEISEEESSKITKRLLTYYKDQLISIKIEEISFIHTENSITYIICLNGKKYTSNSSLDELYSRLDHSIFFRANRQYILSVKGINEILKYGNNQLKIITQPEDQVIVSKNKASEFKKWLEM